jgi:hypothetical protein
VEFSVKTSAVYSLSIEEQLDHRGVHLSCADVGPVAGEEVPHDRGRYDDRVIALGQFRRGEAGNPCWK